MDEKRKQLIIRTLRFLQEDSLDPKTSRLYIAYQIAIIADALEVNTESENN